MDSEMKTAQVEPDAATVGETLKEAASDAADREPQRTRQGGVSRRTFVAGVGGVVVLCALGAVRLTGEELVVRPPGGQDYDRLLSSCIRCGRCVEVCPQRVITLTPIEDGLLTQRMPMLRFETNYCDWCESRDGVPLCEKVCATGALELAPDATAQNTILGCAEIDAQTCLAFRDIGCRYCFDACPYDAIEMNENDRPQVIAELCNGCGACEAACTSLQNGSISSASDERAIKVRAIGKNGELVNSFANGGDRA